MRVDSEGSKISNGWYYILKAPNIWDRDLEGRVWWDEHKQGYVFVPYRTVGFGEPREVIVKFLPMTEAPRIKQCKTLVKMRRIPVP